MGVRTLHSHASTSSYDDFDSNEDFVPPEFILGERIGASRRSGNGLAALAIVLAILLGGAWVLVKTEAPVKSWIAAAVSLMERSAPAPVETATVKAPAPVQKLAETREIVEAPGADTGTAVENPAASAPPAEDESAEETPEETPAEVSPAPLPPPKVDPADPYQKRAMAVGLHPDLSRALLAKLTETDYRNAGVAIRTALAETPDAGVFAWPREPTAKLALFEVKFVKGAAGDCRRYVVTVTKDRWSTTARAMEKCGADLPKRKVAKAAVE